MNNPPPLKAPAGQAEQKPSSPLKSFRSLWPIIRDQRARLVLAFLMMLLNTAGNLVAPVLIARAIDRAIAVHIYGSVVRYGILLIVIYLVSAVAQYLQMRFIGAVAQRMLYRLRGSIFTKLGGLPVGYFTAHKSGDLISRITSDTDKLNTFFSQSLIQFVASIFMMVGAGIFLITLHPMLGTASLVPALVAFLTTRILSPVMRRLNKRTLKSIGGMSAEIEESLQNFKVIIAFNRRDYFRSRFDHANQNQYRSAVRAGIVNTILQPIYGLMSGAGLLIVLAYGLPLVSHGAITIGLLIGFTMYVTRFYDPMKQIATIWNVFQNAMAAWDRISEVLSDVSELPQLPSGSVPQSVSLLEFRNVQFSYPSGTQVLRDASFSLQRGKTYALVGPTGGGKTTTANLMARLFDPTKGTVMLSGRDIREYSDQERTQKIGFILQEPFLFHGTIAENITYANHAYERLSHQELQAILVEKGLDSLLSRFDQGLQTNVSHADSISLGQKQLVAFMRAVLREPELLILDEATANIDTVTEELLQSVLDKLPASTTRVIIAHRLNTIKKADEIFFVNGGDITPAGSLQQAIEMLLHGKRTS